jgi:hypothetical protein
VQPEHGTVVAGLGEEKDHSIGTKIAGLGTDPPLDQLDVSKVSLGLHEQVSKCACDHPVGAPGIAGDRDRHLRPPTEVRIQACSKPRDQSEVTCVPHGIAGQVQRCRELLPEDRTDAGDEIDRQSSGIPALRSRDALGAHANSPADLPETETERPTALGKIVTEALPEPPTPGNADGRDAFHPSHADRMRTRAYRALRGELIHPHSNRRPARPETGSEQGIPARWSTFVARLDQRGVEGIDRGALWRLS